MISSMLHNLRGYMHTLFSNVKALCAIGIVVSTAEELAKHRIVAICGKSTTVSMTGTVRQVA